MRRPMNLWWVVTNSRGSWRKCSDVPFAFRGLRTCVINCQAIMFTTRRRIRTILRSGRNSDFKTFWIPLMDIDRTVGGLAIAVGSHRGGLLEHKKHETAVSYQMEGREQPAVPLEDVPGTWMTTDYRRGDILVFESCTVHRGLPNRSKVVRFSLDVRAQPASTPAGWAWSKSVPEMKEHRRTTLAVCQEAGLTTEQFEKLMIEMHWRGIEAEPAAIRALASKLF